MFSEYSFHIVHYTCFMGVIFLLTLSYINDTLFLSAFSFWIILVPSKSIFLFILVSMFHIVWYFQMSTVLVCLLIFKWGWLKFCVEMKLMDCGHPCRWSGWTFSLGSHRCQCLWLFFFSWADQISQRRLSSLLSEYIPPGC